jgi:arsenite-transporting ATPase
MSLHAVLKQKPRALMFGGKGGVGKTTCAAATALHIAGRGQRALIISTDPAPSLSDSFQQRVGGEMKEIRGSPGLFAIEIEGRRVLKRWKEKFGPEVYEVLSSFLPVDKGILDYLGEAPGIEEEFMLDYILELLESRDFDCVIWDTAPAGHTLRLLTLPSIFIRHLEAAGKLYFGLQQHFDKVRRAARIGKNRRSVVEIVDSWRELALRVVSFLQDPRKTQFIAVAIPEAMCVAQTERMLETFQDFNLSVSHLVVNDVIEDAQGSTFLAERRAMQQHYLQELRRTYGPRMGISAVPLLAHEVHGIPRLREYGKYLFSEQPGLRKRVADGV